MLDVRIKLKHDITENWNNAIGFIPMAGEVIIYDDYEEKTWTETEYGEEVTKTVYIPGIKIGDGKAYVQDLPFVEGRTKEILMDHINNQEVHTTLAEKLFWDNKVNIDDSDEIIQGDLVDDTLIFNRN